MNWRTACSAAGLACASGVVILRISAASLLKKPISSRSSITAGWVRASAYQLASAACASRNSRIRSSLASKWL